MDEELMGYIIVCSLAGITGAGLNSLLNYLEVRMQIKSLHASRVKKYLSDHLRSDKNNTGYIQIEQIKTDILNVFDDFMSHKLTTKMPVLNMFMDEKLISEIRAVFHDEMDAHLPALVKNNLLNENSVSAIAELVLSSGLHYLKSTRMRMLLNILSGGFTGALIGMVAGILLK